MECWSEAYNFCVRIKDFGVNIHCFTISVLVGSGDNYPLMTIMSLPNKRLSFFDTEKPLKAHNTSWWNTPCMATKCRLATPSFIRMHYLALQRGCQMISPNPQTPVERLK